MSSERWRHGRRGLDVFRLAFPIFSGSEEAVVTTESEAAATELEAVVVNASR